MSDSDTPYTSIKRKGQGSRAQKKKTRSSGPLEDEDDAPTPRSLRKRTSKHHENGDANEFGDKRKRRKFQHVVFKSHIKTLCEFLLDALLEHPFADPFLKPVDTVKYPSYLEKIKELMDFSTIKKKMDKDTYTEAEDFAMDVRLIFKNCLIYNDNESDLAFMAQSLRKLFDESYGEIKKREQRLIEDVEFEDMKQQLDSLTKEHQRMLSELDRLVSSPKIPTASVSSEASVPSNTTDAPKKEKKPKRPWDLKRKEALSKLIAQLNEPQIERLGKLYSSFTPNNQSVDGELEIDLENQPDDKLSKLERFAYKELKASGHIDIDGIYSESENETEKKPETTATSQPVVPEEKPIELSIPEQPKPVAMESSTREEKDKKDDKPPEVEMEPLPISSKTTIVQTTTEEKSEDSMPSLSSSEPGDAMQIDNARVEPSAEQKVVVESEPRTVEMTDASITTRS